MSYTIHKSVTQLAADIEEAGTSNHEDASRRTADTSARFRHAAGEPRRKVV